MAVMPTTTITRSPTVERALKEDWQRMLASLERKLDGALQSDRRLVSFDLEDLVGIYSSSGNFEVDTQIDHLGNHFELVYHVMPFAYYPARLVAGLCTAPRSYSEINLPLSHAIVRLLQKHHGKPHTGWILKTIRAKHVAPGRNYSMCLQFERGV